MIERWILALERRYGRLAIGGTPYPLVFVMGLVGILELTGQRMIDRIAFDRELIFSGQVWRLVTFLFVPPSTSPVWLLFALAATFFIATSLERAWGAFRYELYWCIGWALTVACGLLMSRPVGNTYLLMSLMLAFGTMFPDVEFRVFFIIPVKAKWLALLDGLTLVAMVGFESGLAKLLPVIAVGNYLLFFHRTLWQLLRGFGQRAERARAFSSFSAAAKANSDKQLRACKVCGLSEADPEADIRVCTCDQCGEPTNYCVTHVREHLAIAPRPK
jgi:hypothetical protein